MKYLIYFPEENQFIEQIDRFVSLPEKQSWTLEQWENVPQDEIINGFSEYNEEVYPCILLQITTDEVDNATTLKNLRRYSMEKNLKMSSILRLLPRFRKGINRFAFKPLSVSLLSVFIYYLNCNLIYMPRLLLRMSMKITIRGLPESGNPAKISNPNPVPESGKLLAGFEIGRAHV